MSLLKTSSYGFHINCLLKDFLDYLCKEMMRDISRAFRWYYFDFMKFDFLCDLQKFKIGRIKTKRIKYSKNG